MKDKPDIPTLAKSRCIHCKNYFVYYLSNLSHPRKVCDSCVEKKKKQNIKRTLLKAKKEREEIKQIQARQKWKGMTLIE